MEPRVYLVYNDADDGKAQHVVAKNRNDAKTKVDFAFTRVSYRPWVKFIDGKFVDGFGKLIQLDDSPAAPEEK